jgi:hypothetical protein
MMVATPAAVKPSCEIKGMSALTMAFESIASLWHSQPFPSPGAA